MCDLVYGVVVVKYRESLTFSARPSTYRISRAPTSRGKCRKCKRLIPKGAARLEVCAFVCPGRYTLMLRCAGCVDATLARIILSVYKSATKVPADPAVDEATASQLRATITSLSSNAS